MTEQSMSAEYTPDGQRLQVSPGQMDKAQRNYFQDISVAVDGQQVIVATHGGLISATTVTAGVRASQWLGQMADASLQQVSQDRRLGSTDSIQQGRKTDSRFETQHRMGYKLT